MDEYGGIKFCINEKIKAKVNIMTSKRTFPALHMLLIFQLIFFSEFFSISSYLHILSLFISITQQSIPKR